MLGYRFSNIGVIVVNKPVVFCLLFYRNRLLYLILHLINCVECFFEIWMVYLLNMESLELCVGCLFFDWLL